MPSDSQNGHAPEPGPRPGTQPMASSALLTMKPSDRSARAIAIMSSAVRTVIRDRPRPARLGFLR